MLKHAELQALASEKRWLDIVTCTDALSEKDRNVPGFHFFRALAMLKLDRIAEADAAAQTGLTLNPKASWGQKLQFEARLKSGQTDLAFAEFGAYIQAGAGTEIDKGLFVESAAKLGRFEIACAMNATRAVIAKVPKRPKFALALQCFCKADTLEKVFETLLRLEHSENFALVILQDSVVNSPKADRYSAGAEAVKRVLEAWLSRLRAKFFAVEYLENTENLGTAPSCRRLLDHVCTTYDGFFFIEDDCLLVPTALQWAEHHMAVSLKPAGPWFVGCESIFFNREERLLTDDVRLRLEALAQRPVLRNAYVEVDFVPSTCFATTAEIWSLAAELRSCPLGPGTLNRFVKAKNIKTIMPVVPHASDIGMLHELGYSVAHHGVENVRERKGTFVLAEGPFDPMLCRLYPNNSAILYGATTLLSVPSIETLEQDSALVDSHPG